jgi:hypothetical protein
LGDIDARDLRLRHVAPNIDRVGVVADLNVVPPVGRLDELAAQRRVGSINDRQLSFMGLSWASQRCSDTGPALADLLLGDGVDVVLLTPAWPVCTRAVGVLANGFETAAGSLVSSVRSP